MYDTDDIIDILPVDRKSGIALLQHKVKRLRQRHIAVHRHHMLPVGHDIPGFLVIKLEDIVDHLRLAGFQNALLMPFIYHGDDLLLGDIVHILIGIHAEDPHHQIGKLLRKKTERCKYNHQYMHQSRQSKRPLLRLADGKLLRSDDP